MKVFSEVPEFFRRYGMYRIVLVIGLVGIILSLLIGLLIPVEFRWIPVTIMILLLIAIIAADKYFLRIPR